MLETEFSVFVSYTFYALLDEYMLLSVAHLLLLYQQLVVVNPQFLDQVRYLLLLASI